MDYGSFGILLVTIGKTSSKHKPWVHGSRQNPKLFRRGLYTVIAYRESAKWLFSAICLLTLSACSVNPVSLAAKCEIPSTTDETVTGLAVVAVEMRQALEECNRRNGH